MDDCPLPAAHKHRHRTLTERLSQILDMDGEIRKELIGIYQKIQDFFNTDPDKILEEEITVCYGNFRARLENYKEDLMQEERPIIVTGETSSGKSSVLNLLLDFKVLPTAMLPCTGAICRLQNSETKKADIIDFNEKKIHTIEMKDNDEKKFTEELKSYINPKKGREEHQVQYVDIYWPIPFLTKNIFVVDTPGIGENEEMTERLVRYLPNAVALIYVIDPSHSGGIAKDRIVPLFKAIQGRHINGMRQAFDPSCAIFLCNKWDLVDEGEIDEVWRHIKTQLELYWPNMQEKQIYRFSAKETLKTITNEQALPDELIKLRRGIEELIEVSLGAKSRQHVFWLQKLLKTIRQNLKSHLSHCNLSQSQKEEQINKGMKLLKDLKDCEEWTIKKIQQEADNARMMLAVTIHDHLHDQTKRENILQWDKVKSPGTGLSMDEIKNSAIEIIQNLVEDELNNCLRQYNCQETLYKLMEDVAVENERMSESQLELEKILQGQNEKDDKKLGTKKKTKESQE